MRTAYVLLGLAWIIIIAAGAYAFNHSFTGSGDTESRRVHTSTMSSTLILTSSAFKNDGAIPVQCTCDGDQISPPLSIDGVPEGAKSLALIMRDIDVPRQFNTGGEFVHWMLYAIPPDTKEIPVGKPLGVIGENGAGKPTYTGPCPPPQYEPSEHRYNLTLYALDRELQFEGSPTKAQLLAAMEGHIVAQTQLIGTYKRN